MVEWQDADSYVFEMYESIDAGIAGWVEDFAVGDGNPWVVVDGFFAEGRPRVFVECWVWFQCLVV